MISVTDALALVSAEAKSLGVQKVNLGQANGRVLAQDVLADRDFPPFNRATMDGIAISSNAFHGAGQTFVIEDVQPAGHPQMSLQHNINCLEVMTGAMLPHGTDAVIRYEDLDIESGIATVNMQHVEPLQNVHLQGADEKAGQLLVAAGVKITPAIVATLASVGISEVYVQQLPRVPVCATGDELVAVTHQPAPHQIRQSNLYMLVAALQQEGIEAAPYHLPDEPQAMATQIAQMHQQYDVLLFSGAVSKGKYDYLPQVLQQLGMQTLFHSIAQKPGKPLLFGRFANGALVFGFPGNPVSTWVCYQLYFRHWLYKCLGLTVPSAIAALARPLTFKPLLSHHVLVQLINDNGTLKAVPVSTSTSGDMVNLMKAEGFLTLPPNEDAFEEGQLFNVQLF